jgi:hypothetical protein
VTYTTPAEFRFLDEFRDETSTTARHATENTLTKFVAELSRRTPGERWVFVIDHGVQLACLHAPFAHVDESKPISRRRTSEKAVVERYSTQRTLHNFVLHSWKNCLHAFHPLSEITSKRKRKRSQLTQRRALKLIARLLSELSPL